ncbi:MAG: hypothetical protein IKV86_04345 [Clostridia bacterium]|nr:hypothetical protein [Clostridia bacterium]
MFGYVNAYKDLLRVCDYNVFRGYYCGLCKQLGKKFNQLTRFGLSYDMTFLAILMSSLEDKKIDIKMQNCIAHPISKRPVIKDDDGIAYSADMSVILTYMKLKDDWTDEHSIKSFARVAYFFPMKKCAKKYPKQYKSIKENLFNLSKLEKENCQNIDAVADCFGKLLESIFDKDDDNKSLAWLGYHIGRYIYIIDAYKDIEKDLKNKSYNPFIAMYGTNLNKEDFKEAVKSSLTFTLSEVSNAYALLDIKKNKELLDNIIYLGLRKNLDNL